MTRKLIALALLAALGAGCSVRARPQGMIPDLPAAPSRNGRPVVILDVTGTEGDKVMNAELIRARDMEEALREAITRSGVFAVGSNSTGDYRLRVEANAQAPAAGFNMTARVAGTWKLTDARTGKVLLDDFVTASHTATVGEAFVGTTRVRLALEGAARAFISDGLRRLGALSL